MGRFELQWTIQEGDIITNIQKLKEDVTKLVEPYKNYIVADETVVDDAKDIRAKLNKIEKVINDEKKRIKKEFMAPYEELETIAKEAMGIIKEASGHIDKQVKEFEEMWKKDKLEEIEKFFNDLDCSFVTLENIFDMKWLNKTTTTKQWQSEIKATLHDIQTDIDYLGEYAPDEEVKLELVVEYLNNDHDKEKAIERYKAKQKFKKEQQEKTGTITYNVTFENEEDAEVFEAVCKEYEFNYKRRD